MVSFKSLFVAATAFIAGTTAAPGASANATDAAALDKRVYYSSSTGFHGGYYYSFWTDGAGSVAYDNWNGGTYNVKWSGNGNWVGGKGWQTGTNR